MENRLIFIKTEETSPNQSVWTVFFISDKSVGLSLRFKKIEKFCHKNFVKKTRASNKIYGEKTS
jgi:hypothetical protein